MKKTAIIVSAIILAALPLCAQQARQAQNGQQQARPAAQYSQPRPAAQTSQNAQVRPAARQEIAPAKPTFKKVQYLTIDPRDDKAPLEQDVIAIKDIVYAHRSDQDLHIHIYKPSEARRSLPCVMYIQGSGWQKQNLSSKEKYLAKLAAKGYVVASLEYRPVSVAKMPAQARDAAEGFKFLRENAAHYGIDENNMFIWGTSSGGHTALLIGLSMVEGVNAIVDFYGPSDLIGQIPEARLKTYLPGETLEEQQKAAREYSPIYYVTRSAPPIMILHGDVDPVVSFDQSDNLAKKLAEKGAPVVFYCVNGAAHGSPHFWTDTVLTLIDEYYKEYMQ